MSFVSLQKVQIKLKKLKEWLENEVGNSNPFNDS